MGNPAWGSGYHTGFSAGATKGFSDGVKHGSLVTLAVGLGAAGAVSGGKWAYDKIKARRIPQFQEAVAAPDESALCGTPNLDAPDEDDGANSPVST